MYLCGIEGRVASIENVIASKLTDRNIKVGYRLNTHTPIVYRSKSKLIIADKDNGVNRYHNMRLVIGHIAQSLVITA
jgi:hypothetical protein